MNVKFPATEYHGLEKDADETATPAPGGYRELYKEQWHISEEQSAQRGHREGYFRLMEQHKQRLRA